MTEMTTTTDTNHTLITPSGAGSSRIEQAYLSQLTAISAIAPADVIVVNTNLGVLITDMLAVLPRVLKLRPELEAFEFVSNDAIDNLEPALHAVSHAQVVHHFAEEPSDNAGPIELALQMRDQLLSDSEALAKRGLLPTQGLEKLNGTRGHRNIALDLMLLTGLLRHNWDGIEGRTATSLIELNQAEAIAHQVLSAVAARDAGPAQPSVTSDLRNRAFTHFVKTYDEVRRAIFFLRWHQRDANQLAPSIYAGRGRRKSKQGASEPVIGTDIAPGLADDAAETSAAAHAIAALPSAELAPALTAPASE